MGKKTLPNLLSRVMDIRPGEIKSGLLFFAFFFLITAPYIIIKSVRNAQYMIEEGSDRLPIAYLLTAILIGFVVALHSKLQEELPRRVLISISLIFFLVTCFAFGLLFIREIGWAPIAFWVWANVFIIVLSTQFWILVNDVFNPREAKRLIGFFGSGGILGGVAGGFLVGLIGERHPDSLLFLASGILIASIIVVNLIFILQKKRGAASSTAPEPPEKKAAKRGFKDSFNVVRKDKYLKLLAGVVFFTLMVSTFIDWQFNTVINISVDVDEMTSFYGYFNSVMMIIPFLFQFFITSRLIKRFKIKLALLLYPAALLLCFVGIAAFPFVLIAQLVKGTDKSLSFTVNQSGRELLYIPISPKLKYRAKIFIDMFLNRFAKGVAALFLMLIITLSLSFRKEIPTPAMGAPDPSVQSQEVIPQVQGESLAELQEQIAVSIDEIPLWKDRIKIVSALSFFFILGLVYFIARASREYTKTVNEQLKPLRERAEGIVDGTLDVDFMKSVLDTLESRDRSSVLYTLSVFDLIEQNKFTPEVKELLSQKSESMTVSSLDSSLETEVPTYFQEEDYLDDEELKSEIKEIMTLDSYQELMKEYTDSVLKKEGEDAETSKMELAKGIGFMDKDSPMAEKLEELINDKSPEVSRYAMESAAKLRLKEFVPYLIQRLSNPASREDASVSLQRFGPKIVGMLGDYLEDREEDISLRKGIASVLARIGNQDAVDSLSLGLASSKKELLNDIIDALDRIRSEHLGIEFSKEIIRDQIIKELREYYQILISYCDLRKETLDKEAEGQMLNNLEGLLENIFKLLGLIYPYEDTIKAYQNIKTGTKHSMAYAVELMDNSLDQEMREMVIPIIEIMSWEEKARRCRTFLKASSVNEIDEE
jgi:AAA family ATP:ADP antiporter